MQEVFRLIERVGPTEASVLLTGESGSGKELAARSIHECSARRAGPFIAINCGAIPAGLIEAELFGYEKGQLHRGGACARRGVRAGRRAGRCCSTKSPKCRSTCRPGCCGFWRRESSTGSARAAEFTSDVRVIASTNRCPLQAVQSGQLREDLLYRLAVFPIDMPPLRSRGDDVELLAEHFLADLNAQRRDAKAPVGACANDAEAAFLAGQRA